MAVGGLVWREKRAGVATHLPRGWGSMSGAAALPLDDRPRMPYD